MKTTDLHQIALFLFNKSFIDSMEVYTDKHLQEKIKEIESRQISNCSKWLNLILNLDENNLQLLVNYIKQTP